MRTKQMQEWAGDFGRAYTERNDISVTQLDELYLERFGQTRTSLNEQFLSGLDLGAKVLEVGTNVGNQLACLKKAGFSELHGVELQMAAARQAAARLGSAKIAQATAFNLPFQDSAFELVYTAGVLIHIDPNDLPTALIQIHRTSRRFIWGMEYFSPQCKELVYRGKKNLLWSNDFSSRYLELFPDLRLVKEVKLPYLSEPEKADAMFLLEKRPSPES